MTCIQLCSLLSEFFVLSLSRRDRENLIDRPFLSWRLWWRWNSKPKGRAHSASAEVLYKLLQSVNPASITVVYENQPIAAVSNEHCWMQVIMMAIYNSYPSRYLPVSYDRSEACGKIKVSDPCRPHAFLHGHGRFPHEEISRVPLQCVHVAPHLGAVWSLGPRDGRCTVLCTRVWGQSELSRCVDFLLEL